MSRHTIQGNTLVFHTGHSISFPFPVAEAADYTSITLVRLAVPQGAAFNENVFGVDAQGTIVWQVPKKTYLYADSPYTGIQREGDTAILFNWDGLQLTVEAASGKVLAEEHGR
jgi:hypothetical protein